MIMGRQSKPNVCRRTAMSFGYRAATGAFVRLLLSSRRMPDTERIVHPGNLRASSRQIGADLSSPVQYRCRPRQGSVSRRRAPHRALLAEPALMEAIEQIASLSPDHTSSTLSRADRTRKQARAVAIRLGQNAVNSRGPGCPTSSG
jgi:hypothetical protein